MIKKDETNNNHYIDKKEFHERIKEYKKNKCPILYERIGKDFLLLVERIATKYNFRDYSYIEDMKSLALIDCIRCLTLYDEEKYENPFGYFSLAIERAFIREIKKEKRILYTKYKYQLNNNNKLNLESLDNVKENSIQTGNSGDFYLMEKYVYEYEKNNL